MTKAEKKAAEKKAAEKKNSGFAGLKSEFKKIVWPDRDTVVKESAQVIVVTAILSLVIAGLDWVIKTGLDRIF
ncbi:MAG: preprotein translocase subunit SecE [Lachnospiraceae bacterium]|nr:preprotein translocase subunit SecE [Lachnospiraceae bacterium]